MRARTRPSFHCRLSNLDASPFRDGSSKVFRTPHKKTQLQKPAGGDSECQKKSRKIPHELPKSVPESENYVIITSTEDARGADRRRAGSAGELSYPFLLGTL